MCHSQDFLKKAPMQDRLAVTAGIPFTVGLQCIYEYLPGSNIHDAFYIIVSKTYSHTCPFVNCYWDGNS